MPADYEQAFRIVFGTSANPMALFDDERRYVEVNPAASRLHGRPSQEIVGRRFEEFSDESESEAEVAGWDRFLLAGFDSGERRLRRADGSLVEVHYCRQANVLPHRHLGVLLTDRHPAVETGPEALPRSALTPREVEIVGLVALGRSGEEIGRALHISPQTVRTHVRNAMVKQGARTRAHLIALAMRDHLIAAA